MKNFSILTLFLFVFSTIFLINCSSTNNQEVQSNIDSTAIDSTQIIKVLREMYTWNNTDTTQLADFALSYPNKGICVGIDQAVNNNRIAELKQTGYFADDFLDNYKQILKKIDTEIKADTAKYYEGDGLELNYLDANPYCNCQDYPDKYWETLKIKDLVITGNEATTKWFWVWEKEEFSYAVRLKKVNNTWKISSLEGFDSINKLNIPKPKD